MKLPMRTDYDQNRMTRRHYPLLWVMGLLGLALAGGDWFMRFYWFRWQDAFRRPVVVRSQTAGFTSRVVPPTRGDSLTKLIPSAQARSVFEDDHPGGIVYYDAAGFANLPYDAEATFRVVTVGDSYMVVGMPQTNQFYAQLSARLGVPVLNRALAGQGPFQSLFKFIQEVQQGRAPPEWVVWGFIERDTTGPLFVGFESQLRRTVSSEDISGDPPSGPAPAGAFQLLRPDALRKSLPNTSALAQISRKAWALAQFYSEQELPPEVMILDGGDLEAPLLGYKYTLVSMYYPPEVRRLDLAVNAVAFVRDYLAKMGIQLLVMPIPDKEQIYRDRISPSDWQRGIPPPPSTLPEFIRLLQGRGVLCVNLVDPFVEARRRGELLYWRDDTHWNNHGIAEAASRAAMVIQEVSLPSGTSGGSTGRE